MTIDSSSTRPFSRPFRRYLVYRRIFLYFYAPLLVGLALWPCPHKYPWVLPPIAAVLAPVSMVLWKKGNDVGAALLVTATVAGMAAWTVSHSLKLGIPGGSLAFLGAMLPVLVFVRLLAGLAGPADDPRYEDEQ